MQTQQVDALLADIVQRIEASFLAAGADLTAAVDVLHVLQALFDRLRTTFGVETGDRLMALVAGTRGHLSALQGGFDRFLRASEGLRPAVRGVRMEVADLDRVVRTIANVSINARIQGNGLNPPRPQVTAFIARLAAMAAEAEAILAEVREAMAGIGTDMAAMDAVTQDLRDELARVVMPALGRFGRMAQAVLDRQDALAATNATLAVRMQAIGADVSRLVVGLQSGDATRQRLERVRDVLGQTQSGDDSFAMQALAAALGDAAVADASVEIAASVAAAEAVRSESERAVAQAHAFYVVRHSPDEAGRFDDRLASVRAKLDLMRQRVAGLRGRLGTILHHETALRQIGHQVRLSGLNAVLICAKLGEEGRALRELAQWLRTLTDESDAIVQRLQGVLKQTAGQADALDGDAISALNDVLHRFFADAGALGDVLAAIASGRDEAARVFEDAGKTLPQRLGNAAQHLVRFQAMLADTGLATLIAVPVSDADAAEPARPDAATQAVLDDLRSRYTMQAERDVHDRIVGVRSDAMPARLDAVDTKAGAVAQEADDLADILF